MIFNYNKMKLQKKILLFTILITFISIITMGVIAHNLITINMENTLGRQALDLANFVSNLDIVKSAYTLNNPTLVLQPFAESLHSRNLASFVVFMDMEGTRYTHPNKDLIGLRFTGGDEVEALKGRSYISKAVGISGPSIRGFSPIFIDGVQVGAVSVGMFQENVDSLLETNRNALLYTMLMSIIIAIPSAFALSYNIKRTIFGLEPVDIAMLLTQREIMINSVKEGIIFTNKEDKIELINDRACEMLGLRKDDVGKHVKEIIPTSRMDDVRKSGIDEYNEQQKINGVTIITNRMVVKYNENILGVVATFSEKEELQRLAEELTNSKSYASSLRAKTHEFMNQLQTIAGLIELQDYDSAKKFISIASYKNQDILKFYTDRIKDPATIGFLLGKRSEAEEAGIDLKLSEKSSLFNLEDYTDGNTMVLILGNLINNSIEAINSSPISIRGLIELTIIGGKEILYIEVKDNGPGLSDSSENIIKKGFSTKTGNRGYGLYLIYNKVVNLFGGTFHIYSEGGIGTTVEISIPKEV